MINNPSINDFYDIENDSSCNKNTEHICPTCGNKLLLKFKMCSSGYKKGKRLTFWSCSDHPRCKTRFKNYFNGEFSQPNFNEPIQDRPIVSPYSCPTCGSPMVFREGKRGLFLGCSAFTNKKIKCKTTLPLSDFPEYDGKSKNEILE